MVIQTDKGVALILGARVFRVDWRRDDAGKVVEARALQVSEDASSAEVLATLRGDYAADLVRRIQAEAKGEATTGVGPMLARCV